RVRDIRLRSTLIETRNWETVVIPNSMLMKARVEILGQRDGAPLQWRRILDFMVDPGVPPARIIAIVDDDITDSMVRVHLFASLQRAGIRIAEPQRTVHAVQRDEAHAETVRRRELTRRLQALAAVPP